MKPSDRKPSDHRATLSADAMLATTGSMRTLLPEVFYRNPLPSAINAVSAEARYIEVNDAWLTFFGFERDQVLGRPLREIQIWASDSQRRELGELLKQHSRMLDREMCAKKSAGAEADVLVSWETFEHNGRVCMLWVFHDISERKQAERKLRASERRFEKIIEANPLPVTITRLADGVYLSVNQAFEALTGYTSAEVVGKSALDIRIWADPAVRGEIMRQLGIVDGRVPAAGVNGELAAVNRVARIETQARTRAGVMIDVFFSAVLLELEGQLVLHGTVFDLTPVRQAERARAVSEERFATVFGASPNPLAIIDRASGIYADVNQAWLHLYGYTQEETRGHTATDLQIWVEPQERLRLIGLGQASGGVRGFEARHRHRDGSLIDVVTTLEPVTLESGPCWIVCVEDVTVQRRAERERAQLEARLTQVFQVGPHPIVIARASDGTDRHCNNAWHQLFGYSPEEIVGQTAATLGIWVEADFRERRKQILERGDKVRNLETRMRTKSGNIVDMLVSSENVDLGGEAYVVTMMTDVTERKRADRQIEYLATRDYLTGLPNRLLFTDRLRLALGHAARDNTRLALLFIDLDQFKNINDTLGHLAGDQLLVEAAARLSAVLRGVDTIGRHGGDEFLLLLDGLDSPAAAGLVAQKVVQALAAPFTSNGHVMKVSCSIGISIYPDDARNEEDLLRNADLAMYAAKDAGRNGYQFFTASMNRHLLERMALEAQLRSAVELGQFTLYYQPKVSFATGLVTGCEALLRWHLPQGGMMPPGRFISVAEETGLIVLIGAWVLRAACTTLRRWLDAGLAPVPVACNLSAHQFSAALPAQLAALLRETGVPAGLLELEITETVMMSNVALQLGIMQQIKALGVQIALDDFGTGYSSLSYLHRMDFDVLKIDQSFVRDLDSSAAAVSIVAAIIAMAGKFHMKTVAEGVESSEQAAVLRGMQCDEYQGYLFSQPLPADQFEAQYLRAA